MKHSTLIPVFSICAAFALAGCDQAQSPDGQPSGSANEQGQSMQGTQSQQGTQLRQDSQSQGQSGMDMQGSGGSQSSINTGSTDLTQGFALLERSPSSGSTRWTLISEPVGNAAVSTGATEQ